MTRLTSILFLGIAACAHAGDPDPECAGGKCDDTAGGTCEDKRYGDGVCQPSLACAVPDIDCFVTFDDDAAAATWFTAFEQQVAMEELRAPRAIVAEADPRFQKARALLDRGWAAFRDARPVGVLYGKRPAVIVVEDTEPNAFVIPDLASERAGFAVVVQTGILETGATDDQLLGVMMHELQHAVGLHVLDSVADALRTFYIADGREPIGREQVADARATKAGKAWREIAGEVGPYANAELLGLPLQGQLDQIFGALLRSAANNPLGCANAAAQYQAVTAQIQAQLDPESGALPAQPDLAPRVTALYNALRDECFANTTVTFVELVAQIARVTPAEIEASLTPEDRALVANKHVVDAIWALGLDRRAKLRQIEHDYSREVLAGWDTLRYFSYEEDADDVSVTVLREAGLAPAALGDFFLGAFAQPSCTTLLERGVVPPYGVDLVDEHHAPCWRVHHVRQYAEHTAPATAARRVVATTPEVPRPRLLPKRASDRIRY